MSNLEIENEMRIKTIKIIRCLLRNLQELTENENAYDNAANDSVSFNECEAMLKKWLES